MAAVNVAVVTGQVLWYIVGDIGTAFRSSTAKGPDDIFIISSIGQVHRASLPGGE